MKLVCSKNGVFTQSVVRADARGRTRLSPKAFEFHGDLFRIIFRKFVSVEQQFAGLGLNDRQVKALGYAAEKGRITVAGYGDLVDAPKRTLQRDLQKRARKNLLVRHGAAGTTWYEMRK